MDINEISVELIGTSDLRRLAADLATDVWRPAIDTETVYREELTEDGIPGAVRVISPSSSTSRRIGIGIRDRSP